LGDVGLEAVRRRTGEEGFLWWLRGPGAHVWIGARTRFLEVDVRVGPPHPPDVEWTGRGFDFVPLEAVRHARGLPVMRASEVFCPAPDDARTDAERFAAYVAGLEDLRDAELAGDWSRLETARAALPALRRTFRAPWRAAGESVIEPDGVTLRLDTTERCAINNALNWVVNGIAVEDSALRAAFGVERRWARAVLEPFHATPRAPDGYTTFAFTWPELRFTAAAVRSVLADGRLSFPSGDIHTLAGVWEEEMAAVSDQLLRLAPAEPDRSPPPAIS
jgi:hypothetical protein